MFSSHPSATTRWIGTVICSLLLVVCTAEDIKSGDASHAIRVEGDRVTLGQIVIIPTEHRLELPAEINLSEELIEYVLVEEKGKVHESLLVTSVPAMDLQVALLLISEDDSNSEKPAQPGSVARIGKGPDLEMQVQWTDRLGAAQLLPLEQFILVDPPKRPMDPTPWTYQGFKFTNGNLEASVSGSLITIIRSDDALIAYPGLDRDNDEIWFANKTVTPPVGTSVKLIIGKSKKKREP